jgi:dTMP kinase
MPRGALVIFEGAEGVGKTTQVRRLAARLDQLHLPYLHLREPGGTTDSEAIRQLLLDPLKTLVPAAEALLFMASRAQLVTERIRPALEQGTTVILDRFFLSTYAYQIAGRGLNEDHVRAANQLAVGGLIPDVTIFLDLPVQDGLARATARSERTQTQQDRMEQAGDAFHHRVDTAFRTFLTPAWQHDHPECGPIIRVDAGGSEDQVFTRITQALAAARPESFSRLAEPSPVV